MTEQAMRRIQLIFQTQVKILKYPYPGLSYFNVKTGSPLMESCNANPNCLLGLESIDSMRIGRLPLKNNSNLRLVYLSVLIMAYDEPCCKILRRIKNFAYDESSLLTYYLRESIPEEFRPHYEDRLFRKLFVEFFHLVGSRRSSNRVIKFIETHPILDLAFTLLFKRLVVGAHPSPGGFSQKYNTADIIEAVFNKLELTPNIMDRRLRINEHRYLAQDQQFTYMTFHWQDDIDMDFADAISDSSSDEQTNTYTTGNPESTSKFSSKNSNCDSANTKITLEEESNRWVTPSKDQQSPMFQSMIPTRENIQWLPAFVKSPTTSETQKGTKGSLCMDEVEIKCGELKNKLKKLECDVENYNNPTRTRNQCISAKVLSPLLFKQRQTDKKQSNYDCETSFFREKTVSQGPGNAATNTISGLPPLNRLTNHQTLNFPPKKPESALTTLGLRQTVGSVYQLDVIKSIQLDQIRPEFHTPTLQRIGSDTGKLGDSRRTINESETRISSSTSLFLKENPKKIFVRKI